VVGDAVAVADAVTGSVGLAIGISESVLLEGIAPAVTVGLEASVADSIVLGDTFAIRAEAEFIGKALVVAVAARSAWVNRVTLGADPNRILVAGHANAALSGDLDIAARRSVAIAAEGVTVVRESNPDSVGDSLVTESVADIRAVAIDCCIAVTDDMESAISDRVAQETVVIDVGIGAANFESQGVVVGDDDVFAAIGGAGGEARNNDCGQGDSEGSSKSA
jgi:hypothetical protein